MPRRKWNIFLHLLVVRSDLREERHQVVVIVQYGDFVRLEPITYIEYFYVLGVTSKQSSVFMV